MTRSRIRTFLLRKWSAPFSQNVRTFYEKGAHLLLKRYAPFLWRLSLLYLYFAYEACESKKSLWNDIHINPTLTIYYIKVPNGRNTIGDYIIHIYFYFPSSNISNTDYQWFTFVWYKNVSSIWVVLIRNHLECYRLVSLKYYWFNLLTNVACPTPCAKSYARHSPMPIVS